LPYALSEGLAAVRFSNRWHFIEMKVTFEMMEWQLSKKLQIFQNGLLLLEFQGRWDHKY